MTLADLAPGWLYTITPPRPEDLAVLPAIELAAARLLVEIDVHPSMYAKPTGSVRRRSCRAISHAAPLSFLDMALSRSAWIDGRAASVDARSRAVRGSAGACAPVALVPDDDAVAVDRLRGRLGVRDAWTGGSRIRMLCGVVIRPAVISERQALESLQRRASLSNPGDREALLANPDTIELPTDQIAAGQVLVAETEGTIVGFAALLPREDGGVDLDGLFVEPHVWGQGIGRLLVEHCVLLARTQGAAALHVVGNPHAEGFYRACGFERVGTADTRFGVGLLLRRAL